MTTPILILSTIIVSLIGVIIALARTRPKVITFVKTLPKDGLKSRKTAKAMKFCNEIADYITIVTDKETGETYMTFKVVE